MSAVFVTPLLHASPAIELSSRTWRKRILPVGQIEYQGRTLQFSRAYLAELARAFRSGVYDQVPFQRATAGNEHTNDPERTRGEITDLEAGPDGLYATVRTTEAGEQILAANPALGVSARIVENYQRSDGKFFPVAIQHVLGCLDPRIPALGPWQPVEMSNAGQRVIDLSTGSGWLGEPGPAGEPPRPAGDDELTPAELAELDQVVAEVDDEMRREAQMNAFVQSTIPRAPSAELANFSHAIELAHAAEQRRQAEDAAPAPRSAEDRIARAMSRAAAGTLTPQGQFARSYGLSNSAGADTGQPNCGHTDEGTGLCIERYHAHGCGSVAAPDAADGLRPALAQIAARWPTRTGAAGKISTAAR